MHHKFITRYHGPRVMQKYEIREEMIKVKISSFLTTTPAQVVRIGSDKTEAVEVLFILDCCAQLDFHLYLFVCLYLLSRGYRF